MRTLKILLLAEVWILIFALTLLATDVSGPVSGTWTLSGSMHILREKLAKTRTRQSSQACRELGAQSGREVGRGARSRSPGEGGVGGGFGGSAGWRRAGVETPFFYKGNWRKALTRP